MKKLLMAAIIAAIACVSNAATYKWTVDGVPLSDGSKSPAEGYMVYFIETAAYSLDNAKTDLGKGNTAFVSNSRWNGATDEDGYLSMSKLKKADSSEYAANDTITGYLVVFDADTPASAKNYLITDTITSTFPANGGNVSGSFGDLSSATWSSLSSGPDPVPEPTSGLLLVLGMAGLALRRKQK